MIWLVLGLVVPTALYLILSAWARSVRRENLEEEWDSDLRTGDREAFIEEGMRAYDRSLRPRLFLGVFVIPVLFVLGMIYVMNYL